MSSLSIFNSLLGKRSMPKKASAVRGDTTQPKKKQNAVKRKKSQVVAKKLPGKKVKIPSLSKSDEWSKGSTGVLSNSQEKSSDRPTARTSRSTGDGGGVICVVCRDAACLRLVLRNCHHVVCVACLIGYLQGQIVLKAKVAIRCPSGVCAREIHENDIWAVFDKDEPGLDVFMSPTRRQWLQYCHEKDSVVLGLAGADYKNQEKLLRRCPLCKNIYYRRAGCHNVICPNLRCRTRFCWTCGQPIRGIGHFAGGKCHVAFDDVARGTVILFLIHSINTIGFVFAWPAVFLLFHMIMPMYIFFACPFYAGLHVYRKATVATDWLTPQEWFLLIIKVILAVAVGLLVALPVSLGSIFTGECFFMVYNAVVALKFCGLLDKIADKYDLLLPFANLLGLTDVKSMLQEGREEKKRQKERRRDEKERDKMAEASVLLEKNP